MILLAIILFNLYSYLNTKNMRLNASEHMNLKMLLILMSADFFGTAGMVLQNMTYGSRIRVSNIYLENTWGHPSRVSAWRS